MLSDNEEQGILILGKAYVPRMEDDYNGTLFRSDEVDHNLCASLNGLDVLIEHDEENPVGKIIDSFIDKDGSLMTFLHIKGDPACNMFLPEKLAIGSGKDPSKRFFNDLSLGHEVAFEEVNGRLKVVRKVPQEVSIVQVGDNEGTHISDWWFVNGSSENIRSKFIPSILKI